MNRPYIICHMVTSVDGAVTGDFLFRPECQAATEVYYEINRACKAQGFLCGRVTMEGSFTNGWAPDLDGYEPKPLTDYVPEPAGLSGFYAVAFDPKGKLGWKTPHIVDDDPGYDNAQIIEVLTRQVDPRYLGYLQSVGIPYIFAGEQKIDVLVALAKLKESFAIDALLLEGGSIVNGYFIRAGAVDELSLVVAPMTAGEEGKPLFADGAIKDFTLSEIRKYDDSILWLNYKKDGGY